MQNNKENTNAFLIHISSFTGYLFPLVHPVNRNVHSVFSRFFLFFFNFQGLRAFFKDTFK